MNKYNNAIHKINNIIYLFSCHQSNIKLITILTLHELLPINTSDLSRFRSLKYFMRIDKHTESKKYKIGGNL